MQAIVDESLKVGERRLVHRFERAGLGKAPFHFTGRVTEKVFVACHGAPEQPGSNCDYCSTGIKFEFWVRSADGREFKVGCDCIHKTEDRGLIQAISVAERKLRDERNAKAKARKSARAAARVATARERLASVCSSLRDQPHPNHYFASQGKTLLDYVQWCLEHGNGVAAATIIERA